VDACSPACSSVQAIRLICCGHFVNRVQPKEAPSEYFGSAETDSAAPRTKMVQDSEALAEVLAADRADAPEDRVAQHLWLWGWRWVGLKAMGSNAAWRAESGVADPAEEFVLLDLVHAKSIRDEAGDGK
jgi:hypothetical protein